MNRSRAALASALCFALAQTACAASGTGATAMSPSHQSSSSPLAKPPSTGTQAPAEAEAAYYWYDGEHRRELARDPSTVADFRNAAGQPVTSGDTDSSANPLGKEAVSRTPLRSKSAIEELPDGGLPEGVSPVLREAFAPESQVQALPGGVVVTLKQAPAGSSLGEREAQARSKLTAAGLEPLRAIDPFQRVWLVASSAGLASLELANRIHESGAFESAAPNWWRPRATK